MLLLINAINRIMNDIIDQSNNIASPSSPLPLFLWAKQKRFKMLLQLCFIVGEWLLFYKNISMIFCWRWCNSHFLMLHLYRDWVPQVSDYSICDDNFVILLLQSWPSMFLIPIKPNNHIYSKYPKNFFKEIKIFLIK